MQRQHRHLNRRRAQTTRWKKYDDEEVSISDEVEEAEKEAEEADDYEGAGYAML